MHKKILILGPTGMLGNAVAKYFLSNNNRYDVTLTYRNPSVAFGDANIRFDVLSDNISHLPTNFDYVINCIGIIKPFMSVNLTEGFT